MDSIAKRGARNQQTILKRLEPYPHSFQMKDRDLLRRKVFEGLRNDLEARLGRKAGYSSPLQTASTRNLLAFVWFQLDEHQKALEETDVVLKMDDQRNNIVSLANKAYMLSKLCSFDDAEEALDELDGLRESPEFGYLLVKAKAELAASYMRFGPRFNQHAVNAFREVLPEAKEPEVWMWKYCLAVTYRHALDLQHAPYLSHGQSTVTHENALKLFKEVINSEPTAGEEAAHRNLKANAYAEMALLLRLTWDKTSEYRLCSQVQMGPSKCCKKALKLDDNDASVLWKSGKVFRNEKDLSSAKRLLEKAVTLQPSSAAYHHLGLTYKALATNLQHGKRKTRRAGKREQRRRKAVAFQVKRLQLDRCPSSPGRRSGSHPSGHPTQQSVTADRVKKVVKSPNNDATKFDPAEPNVLNAIKYLNKAVEFSAGENTRAAYDLALMYAATEEVDKALQALTSIARRQDSNVSTPSGYLERITSLEQMGLIYRQRADRELDADEKRKWTKKSDRSLNDALSLASEMYSTTSVVKNIFGQIFQSPRALLAAAEASDCSETTKRKVKANIFSLMNNHKQSLASLHDIAEEERDAEYYKLKIHAFARSGQYGEAVATISYLKATKLYDRVLELLEQEDDPHSVFNIYLEAGQETLLDGPCNGGYFTTALRREPPSPDHQMNGGSSALGEDFNPQGATARDAGSGEPGPEDLWDVMLLHDEEDDDIERKAERLGDILRAVCGLRVVIRNENYFPGSNELGSLLSNIEKSRIVVVMPGQESPSNVFDKCVSVAAMKASTVVLLTEGIGPDAVPPELNTPRHRAMDCPAELFAPDVDVAGPCTPELTSAVSRLIRFLANRG